MENEFKSISSVLFNRIRGPIFATEGNAFDDIMKIVNESVDTYIEQKIRRIEKGREPIGNPGLYVRTIMKKKLELLNVNLPLTTSIDREQPTENHVIPCTDEVSKFDDINPKDREVDALLQSFIRKNDIGPNEINENCLLSLSQYSLPIVKSALEVYVKQKRKRDMNGLGEISDPSSYVMAVLR